MILMILPKLCSVLRACTDDTDDIIKTVQCTECLY